MTNSKLPRIALTPGEPAGIGPDICLQWAMEEIAAEVVAFADPDMLRQRARQLGLAVRVEVLTELQFQPHQPGVLRVWPVPCAAPVVPGWLNPANAAYVLECLRLACHACQRGEFDAMLTAPVHKGIINEAGIAFSGHTEFLAELTATPLPVMLLAVPGLRVALATTHLPLRDVSAAITPQRLSAVLRVLEAGLRRDFGLAQPRIAVCGLNPHAGEGGHLGREEIDVIQPVIEQLRAEGLHLLGALPADTAFTPAALRQCDAVLAMYHDQGLPVLKARGFGEAVNITLGLPIIRVSVDHGTALPLAGSGQARWDSLRHAGAVAMQMAQARAR
jgi:4-hydroxythreonine-4-phosphate dehydrogenase